jgi:hypothetical protein
MFEMALPFPSLTYFEYLRISGYKHIHYKCKHTYGLMKSKELQFILHCMCIYMSLCLEMMVKVSTSKLGTSAYKNKRKKESQINDAI